MLIEKNKYYFGSGFYQNFDDYILSSKNNKKDIIIDIINNDQNLSFYKETIINNNSYLTFDSSVYSIINEIKYCKNKGIILTKTQQELKLEKS